MQCNSDKWNRRYLELAKHVSTWSKDPLTQVGCVIVNMNGGIVACGFNGFPHGEPDSQELYLDIKYKAEHCVHAEENALRIANIPRYETKARLYTTFAPCCRCAQAIVDHFWIKTVISADFNHAKIIEERGNQYWIDLLTSTDKAINILHKSNIDFRFFPLE